jgi:hypothetical protein
VPRAGRGRSIPNPGPASRQGVRESFRQGWPETVRCEAVEETCDRVVEEVEVEAKALVRMR